jgi:hypothetical protein
MSIVLWLVRFAVFVIWSFKAWNNHFPFFVSFTHVLFYIFIFDSKALVLWDDCAGSEVILSFEDVSARVWIKTAFSWSEWGVWIFMLGWGPKNV